ncbi:MAG: hypothetical protein IPK85_08115 [Gemmatimonadetes bacterium]|nr:hypothetical protein [Gemmatimonadota bacterium]
MTSWITRIRGAVGTGITWAAGWAVAGIGIGAASLLPWHPFERFMQVMDAPLPAMAIPGFFAGLLFSGVVGVAARRVRFEELTSRQFIAWGAIGGALLVLFPFLLVAVGLASTEGSVHSGWSVIEAIAPVFVALSSASAAGSLLIARRARDRRMVEATERADRTLGEGQPELAERSTAQDFRSDRIPR